MMETGAIVSICCGHSSFEVVGGHSGKIFLLLAATRFHQAVHHSGKCTTLKIENFIKHHFITVL